MLVQTEVEDDPPIAPGSIYRVTLEKAERAKPPAGIFDLPAGLKKAAD